MGSRNLMLHVNSDFLSLGVDVLNAVEDVVVAFPLIPRDRRDTPPFVDEAGDRRRDVLADGPQFFKARFDIIIEDSRCG